MSDLSFDIDVRIESFEKGLAKASSSITKFANENEKKFKQFGKNVTEVGKKLSVGLTGSIAVATGAMFALTKNVGDTADRLLDLSDITGMTTDSIQEYQYVAKQAGVSTEAITNAAEGLTRRLISTSEAGSSATQMMHGLGIATKNSNGELRNASDIMDDSLKVLADMENQTERNALGAQMFGGAWKDLAPILSMGSDGIEKARQEARDLGIVLDEDALNSANKFRQATVKLTAQLDGLKNQIGAKLAPIMTNTLIPAIQNYIIPLFQRLGDFVSKIINWFSGLESGTKKLILVITGLASALGPVLVAVGGLISFLPVLLAGFGAIISPIGLVIAGLTALAVVIYKNWDAIKSWVERSVNAFIRIYNESLVVRIAFENIILQFKTLFNVGKFVFSSLWTIIKTNFRLIMDTLKAFGTTLEGVLTLNISKINQGLNDFSNSLKSNVGGAINEVSQQAKKLFDDVSNDAINSFNKILSGKKEPFKFDTSEESTKNLENKVAEAVEKGATKGLGRARVSGVSELEPTTEAQGANIQPVGELFQREQITENLHGITEEMLMFNAEMENLIGNSIANTFSNLGNVIGDALTGGRLKFEDIGRTLIQGFASFLGELGDMLIQYGTFAKLKGKLDLAVKAGGIASIAAGGAGIALGVALKAISGAIGNRASSGFGGGGTGATAVSGGTTSTFSSSTRESNEVVFRIQGEDLEGVLRRRNVLNGIIGG